MTPEVWTRLAAGVERALDAEGPARAAQLAALRADPALAPHVDALLAALRGADAFAAALARDAAGLLVGPTLSPGENVGPWQIDALIGWGGMGVVYRAHRADAHFDKTVAVKVISAALHEPEDRARFHAERQTLARLEHVNIARLIDAGLTDDGRPYTVLEHVVGRPADAFADGAGLDAVLAMFLEVCDAVDHAHANLVVHCDVKPSNVLVTPEGRAKLLDFGIARRTSGAAEPPESASLSAPLTRSYAAPELVLGGRVDIRTDVYSLGLLLFRVLTGRVAYQLPAGTATELAAFFAGTRIPSLTAAGHLARCSPMALAEWQAIIERSAAVDRASRTPSARHLAEQVRRVRDGGPLEPPPTGIAAYRVRAALRRNPVAAALGATSAAFGLVALATLAIALVTARAQSARIAEQRAVADRALAFVVEVFEDADPEDGLSAKQIVEGAAARLERRPVAADQGAARLDLTVGRLAGAVGAYPTAERLLARAASGSDDPARAREARIRWAQVVGDGGDWRAALDALATIRDACERDADHGCMIEVRRLEAGFEQNYGDPRAAVVAALDGRARALALPADAVGRDRAIADLTFVLAAAYHGAGQWEQATPLFDEAVARMEAAYGPSATIADALSMLAAVDVARGEIAAARERLERARALYAPLVSPQSHRLASVDRMLGSVYLAEGRVKDAVAASRRALAAREDVLGPSHPDTVESLVGLARALEADAADAEATRIAARARDLSTDPMRRAFASRILARLYARAGRKSEAVALGREALAVYEERVGADAEMTRAVAREVAEIAGP